jgi:hypothetical protein
MIILLYDFFFKKNVVSVWGRDKKNRLLITNNKITFF